MAAARSGAAARASARNASGCRGDSGRVVREAVDVRVEEAQRNGPSERTGAPSQPVGDYGAGAGRRRGLDALGIVQAVIDALTALW